MANGLFIPNFRGPGSPGAPGVGSTQRALQLVERGRNQLAQQGLSLDRAQAAQPGLIRQDELALQGAELGAQGARDQARVNSIVQGALQLKQIRDPQQKMTFLMNRREELQSAGLDTNDTDEAINLIRDGRLDELEQVTDQAISLGRDLGILGGQRERFSPTTTTLPDGTTVQTTSTGRKVVTDISGNVLKGEEATKAIVGAEKFKTEQQLERAGGRRREVLEAELELEPTVKATTKAAEQAIKKSTEAFDRLEPIQTNIANIDEAIRLIDEGAATGPIISRLPSIRQSSIELDTLQKRLGLDVIAGTTFGALSEGEREFALSTALPSTLEGPALREWLQRKKDSQTKLAAQLSEAATFLGTPGNTIADYIELKKLEGLRQEEQSQQGQQLQEGTIIRNPTTGQRLQVVNGQLVEAQ